MCSIQKAKEASISNRTEQSTTSSAAEKIRNMVTQRGLLDFTIKIQLVEQEQFSKVEEIEA